MLVAALLLHSPPCPVETSFKHRSMLLPFGAPKLKQVECTSAALHALQMRTTNLTATHCYKKTQLVRQQNIELMGSSHFIPSSHPAQIRPGKLSAASMGRTRGASASHDGLAPGLLASEARAARPEVYSERGPRQSDALPQRPLHVQPVVIVEQLGIVHEEYIRGWPCRRLRKVTPERWKWICPHIHRCSGPGDSCNMGLATYMRIMLQRLVRANAGVAATADLNVPP